MSNCIVLGISKLTKKFHVFESNYLIAAFLDDKVDWVQLIIQHFCFNDVDDTSFYFALKTIYGNCLCNPRPPSLNLKKHYCE